MNRCAFYSLGLDINQVVYLRRNKNVVGARYLGVEVSGVRHITKHIFYRADGETEKLHVTCGYLTDISKRVYPTIEDAIHDTNPIQYQVVVLNELLKTGFCFTTEVSCIGCMELGKTMWRWDGFQPIPAHIHYSGFKITWDGEWGCEYIGDTAYYQTEQECIEDNHVDVITF